MPPKIKTGLPDRSWVVRLHWDDFGNLAIPNDPGPMAFPADSLQEPTGLPSILWEASSDYSEFGFVSLPGLGYGISKFDAIAVQTL